MEKFARKCDCCGKGMNEGYYDAGQYYCSDRCLIWGNSNDDIDPDTNHGAYSMEDWRKESDANPDECYWTEWEELDEEEYYDADGNVYS